MKNINNKQGQHKPTINSIQQINQQSLLGYLQYYQKNKQKQQLLVSFQLKSQIKNKINSNNYQLLLNSIIPLVINIFINNKNQQYKYLAKDYLLEILSSQLKYNYQQKQSLYKQQPLKQVSQNTVIALPCQQQTVWKLNNNYQNNLKLVVHSQYATDQNDAKKPGIFVSQSQYYQQDYLQFIHNNQNEKQIISSKQQLQLKIVQRQQITKFFSQAAKVIDQKLISNIFNSNDQVINLPKRNLIFYQKLLQIIQYLQHSLFTFYLMKIINQIEITLLQYFNNASKNKQKLFFNSFNKDTFQKIIYIIKSIGDRWSSQKNQQQKIKKLKLFSQIQWEWQVKQLVLQLLLESNISQQQLYSVKQINQLCRRAQLKLSGPTSQQLLHYIRSHEILRKIYKPDNHPEVIIKGKDIFQFVSYFFDEGGIQQKQLSLVFNLLDKSQEQVCKFLYITIQNVGQKNLQTHRQYMISQIMKLNRASLFIDQAFCLLEMLILLTPLEFLSKSLNQLYQIMDQHYLKLKKEMKQRIMNIYFELFIMGVQENVFGKSFKQAESQMIDQNQQKPNQNQGNPEKIMIKENQLQLTALQPIKNKLNSQMAFVMIETFVQQLQKQKGRKIQQICHKILVNTIKILFTKYKIHQICLNSIESQHKRFQLKSLAKLLRIYDNLVQDRQQRVIINNQQMCQLMAYQHSFCQFLHLYNQEKQYQVLKFLLNKYFTSMDIQNQLNIEKHTYQQFLEIYLLTSQKAKQKISPQLKNMFFNCQLNQSKQNLGRIYFQINHIQFQILLKETIQQYNKIKQLSQNTNQIYQFWSNLLLILYKLQQSDKNGYGSYLPFKSFGLSEQITVKMINSLDVFAPFQSTFSINSQKTIKQLISRVIQLVNMPIQKLKIKLNQRFLVLNDFHLKIADYCPYKQVTLTIYQSTTSQWFDKCQLLSQGSLTPAVLSALREIHGNYAQKGRLYKRNFAKIFEIVTDADKIQVNDDRISQIYNKYSDSLQHLTLQQWLTFYFQSAVMNPCLVVQNLKKLGYSHLFKDADFMNCMSVQQNKIREYIVKSTSQQSLVQTSIYNVLLQNKIQNKSIESLCIKILQSLPINQNILNKLEITKKCQQKLIEEQDSSKLQSQFNMKQLWYYSGTLSRIINKKQNHQQQLSITNKENWNQLIFKSKIYQSLLQATLFYISILKDQQSYANLPKFHQQAFQNVLSLQGSKFIEISLQITNQPNLINPFEMQFLANLTSHYSTKQYKQLISFELIEKLSQQKNGKFSEGLILTIKNLLIIYIVQLPSEQKKQQNFSIVPNSNLVFHSNKDLRKIFNNFYLLVSKIFNPVIKNTYYNMNCKTNSQQYFSVLLKFIMEQQEANDQFYTKIVSQIGKLLLKQSEKHSKLQSITHSLSLAQISQSQNNQQMIIGRLKILKLIQLLNPNLKKQQNEQGWLQKIQNLCYSADIRQIYYQLINKFYDLDYNLQKIWNLLNSTKPLKNSLCKNQNIKYMGLYNLGCICYINATLQQLFMIQPFRNLILSINSKYLNKEEQNKSSYFEHFQYIFYQLAFGNRGFFVPEKFCQNFTDYTGQPINVKQQHDADQFLNRLLDRLQTTLQIVQNNQKSFLQTNSMQIQVEQNNHLTLKNQRTSLSQIIQNNLSGHLINTIQCQSCLTNKNKLQKFYVLTLQIKDLKSLNQCLDKFIQPQIICDFYCQQCEAKVETIHKYHSFDNIPPYVFIHLQRLVFDLQSFSKVRLDTIIDFPLQIDFSKYFYKGNNKKKIQPQIYELRGFIVHLGTSQSGHYYSLIKQKKKSKSWIKFDDSRIDTWDWNFGGRQKQNAYILIYQKKKQSQQKQINSISSNSNITYKNTQLDKKVLQYINEDNIKLYKQVVILDYNFPKYIQKTLSRIMIPNALTDSSPNNLLVPYHPQHLSLQNDSLKNQMKKALRVIFKYFQFLSQIKDVGLQYDIINDDNLNNGSKKSLVNKISSSAIKRLTFFFIMFLHLMPSQAQILLEENYQKSIKVIISHPQFILRQAYRLILVKLFSISLCNKNHLIVIHLPKHLQNSFVQILSGLQIVGRNPNRMNQYFDFLYQLCTMSKLCIEWLNNNNLAPKLVHFMMQGDSHLKNQLKSMSNISLGNKKHDCFDVIIKTVQILLMDIIQKKSAKGVTSMYEIMNQLHYIAFTKFDFYRKMLEERYQYHSLNRILCIFCYQNNQLSEKVANFLKSALNRQSHKDSYIYAYLHLMHGFLVIEDSLQMKRLYTVLGIPLITTSEITLQQQYENIHSQQKMEIQMEDLSKKQDKSLNKLNKAKHNARIIYYRSFAEQDGDQFLFPFLQLLYINRNQLNYFSILGTTTLLRLIRVNYNIFDYMLSMPASTNRKLCVLNEDKGFIMKIGYLQWIQKFLQILLNNGNLSPLSIDKQIDMSKKRVPLSGLNEHQIANQIAKILSQIENKFEINNINQQNEQPLVDFQLKKRQSEQLQKKYIQKVNKYYPNNDYLYLKPNQKKEIDLSLSEIEIIDKVNKIDKEIISQMSQQNIPNYNELIKISYIILKQYKDQNQKIQKSKAYFMSFELKLECHIIIHFNSNNFKYSILFKAGEHEFGIPYIEQLEKNMKIELVWIPKIKSNKNFNKNNEKQNSPIKIDTENDFPTITETYENSKNNINNEKNNDKANQQNNMQFLCPFCMYTSSTYHSRCANCGQQLGQLM